MIRYVFLAIGFFLLFIEQYISTQLQFIFFLTGIVILGVPHGAADLLVATRYATDTKKSFSTLHFFVNYLSRLVLFALVLWIFPLTGILLFIFFAAYHFGETDLHQFKTDILAGKLFVVSYGLVILGVILFNHLDEIISLLRHFEVSSNYISFLNFIQQYRYTILSCCGLLFFASAFFYFSSNKAPHENQGQFLIQFALILIILYNLPMVLGFTFYFIVWHSVLSLRNIVGYLRKDNLFSIAVIFKQISIYSLLAMAGVILFGLTGFMFVNNNTLMIYIFLGLAVLTAPHLQIMHEMYNSIRIHDTIVKEV